MATEKLNFNAINANADWTGVITDVDEAISGADGNSMDSIVDDAQIDFGITDSAVEDADTVTGITITLRAKHIGSDNDRILCTLLIGGVGQGSQNTGSLTNSFANIALNDVGWDVDRSAADMDGAEVRCVCEATGMPHTPDIQLDCGDIDVVYTEAGGGVNEVPLLMAQYQPG